MKWLWVIAYAYAAMSVVRDLTFLLTGIRPVSTASIAFALAVLLIIFVKGLGKSIKDAREESE